MHPLAVSGPIFAASRGGNRSRRITAPPPAPRARRGRGRRRSRARQSTRNALFRRATPHPSRHTIETPATTARRRALRAGAAPPPPGGGEREPRDRSVASSLLPQRLADAAVPLVGWPAAVTLAPVLYRLAEQGAEVVALLRQPEPVGEVGEALRPDLLAQHSELALGHLGAGDALKEFIQRAPAWSDHVGLRVPANTWSTRAVESALLVCHSARSARLSGGKRPSSRPPRSWQPASCSAVSRASRRSSPAHLERPQRSRRSGRRPMP